MKFTIQLIVFLLLFSNAEAAISAVNFDNVHSQDAGHMIHDHDEQHSNTDENTDSCDHYCHCTHSIGIISSTSIHNYQSQLGKSIASNNQPGLVFSPPLLRPPIVRS